MELKQLIEKMDFAGYIEKKEPEVFRENKELVNEVLKLVVMGLVEQELANGDGGLAEEMTNKILTRFENGGYSEILHDFCVDLFDLYFEARQKLMK